MLKNIFSQEPLSQLQPNLVGNVFVRLSIISWKHLLFKN